jgi:hypothetical protein
LEAEALVEEVLVAVLEVEALEAVLVAADSLVVELVVVGNRK